VASAIEHATEYLLSLGLDRASDANGERIGLQATLVAPGVGPEGLALDALVSAPRPPVEAMRSSAAPTARVSRLLEEKLGFGPEPELFSNMLFVAALGATATGPLRDLPPVSEELSDRSISEDRCFESLNHPWWAERANRA